MSLGRCSRGVRAVGSASGRGHPGDGAVELGKRHSPDPEASFNAVLPVFHLCCMLFIGVLVSFWEKKGVSVEPGAYPGPVRNAAPRQTALRPQWR